MAEIYPLQILITSLAGWMNRVHMPTPMLAESRESRGGRPLFGDMLRRIWALPVPAG